MASIKQRPDGKWRARYRDPSGKEHAQHFLRKTDAQRWLDETTAAIVTGQYVDPRSGKITFRQRTEQWRSGQMHRPSTEVFIERQLRLHVYPVFGDRPLSSIKPSEIQQWVKRLSNHLAPSTVGIIHGIVSGIFRAAVQTRSSWTTRARTPSSRKRRKPRSYRSTPRSCMRWPMLCPTAIERW
jgi:hypothetical protein